jgi:hypothetical protein
VSAFLGIFAGAILGLVLTVLFQDALAGFFVRLLGPLAPFGQGRRLAGEWYAYYELVRDGQAVALPGVPLPQNEIELLKFSHLTSAVVARSIGSARSYLLRLRFRDGSFLTGVWSDRSHGRYHFGAVQLVWDYNGRVMVGKFVGRDRHGIVNHGPWFFARDREHLQPLVDGWRATCAAAT